MRILILSFLLSLGISASAATALGVSPEVTIDHAQRGFTIQTERLKAIFRDGRIVHLRNLLTGELIADEQLAETNFPSGLGHLSGGVPTLSKLHSPWGTMGNSAPTAGIYHYPGDGSTFTCAETEQGVQAEWYGLRNGAQCFTNELLRITAKSDSTGALVFRASALSPSNGVFSVTVPLINILPGAQFFLPHFGGMRFDAGMRPALRTFGAAPFYEAPIMALEYGKGSLALWKEDARFHPYFTYFNWTGKSFAFAFEHLNLMPFEPHTQADSVSWKLDVTEGSWMKAMAPYRNWYAAHFAHELSVRDAVEWAERIGVVIDSFSSNKAVLDQLTNLFSSASVLMHEWNARAPSFDTDLPDWTPRDGYVDRVTLFREYGLKTMAYVNTYCANYNSPVWQRDNLHEKFLTRKYSLIKYGQASQDQQMDKLIGDVQGTAAADQFADIKDGSLIYGDPLSFEWRQYHVDQMQWWNSTTGTDANYEDTAGCAGDFGNAVVDGKFAAQGSVAMMRELLDGQPTVPMASEYGPAAIAFAVKWPLVYAQVWGGKSFRAFRKHAQVPINAYLFGYRIWIPTINAGTDFLKHVVTACSDATGGMGMTFASSTALDCRSGFTGHMTSRAQLFANRGLKPFFDPEMREPNLVCTYRDRREQLYRYTDDGRVQRMTGPDGIDLYARVENTNCLETALCIPDWPAVSGNTLFGLDPHERYALFPKSDTKPPPIQINDLPQGIAVRMFRHESDYALLVLDRIKQGEAPAQATVPIKLNRSFATVCVNATTRQLEADAPRVTLDMTFPAHILFASAGSAPEFDKQLELDFNQLKIHKVSLATGLRELTLTNNLPVLARTITSTKMVKPRRAIALWGAGWENNLDFLIRVPSRGTSVRVYTQASKTIYGDGTIAKLYINGECVKSLDNRRPNPAWKPGMPKSEQTIIDSDVHDWSVPVGDYAGNAILITIASDPKKDGNSDQQWISIPELIEDKSLQTGK